MQVPTEDGTRREEAPQPFMHEEFQIEGGTEAAPNVEHQFIPSFPVRSPVHRKNNDEDNVASRTLSPLRNGPEEISFSLQLGEPEPKRRKEI